jgi:hypothetical protein
MPATKGACTKESLDANQLDAEAAAVKEKLQTALDRYANPRLPALVSAFDKG